MRERIPPSAPIEQPHERVADATWNKTRKNFGCREKSAWTRRSFGRTIKKQRFLRVVCRHGSSCAVLHADKAIPISKPPFHSSGYGTDAFCIRNQSRTNPGRSGAERGKTRDGKSWMRLRARRTKQLESANLAISRPVFPP